MVPTAACKAVVIIEVGWRQEVRFLHDPLCTILPELTECISETRLPEVFCNRQKRGLCVTDFHTYGIRNRVHSSSALLIFTGTILLALFTECSRTTCAGEPRKISGIYPSLAMFNNENECGTGAVVPWADRLWVITYGPHLPFGSSDRLYEITPDLQQIIRPESVGGTHANRMIHRESQQLIIGSCFVGADRTVRVISPLQMPGRLTGTARHLTQPADKVYFATMEEGLYEVDVRSLHVNNLIRDENRVPDGKQITTPLAEVRSVLPGYHGKGLYSGQGRLVYSNNGDHASQALTDPATPSGALAEWSQPGTDWQLIRRNQFTEVTGPGGILGSDSSAPVWSIGWDVRSLLLMVLDNGKWYTFRLPKVSHSYDGAHGWNTEWPRIREIGDGDLLMTMHGAFWRFPREFDAQHTDGIRVRSAYLKVIGDFSRWNDRLVFGCDDAARSEFLNKRSVKGSILSVGQSHSNLWFLDPKEIDHLGPAPASGALWLHDSVRKGDRSDPFLVAGWQQRTLWEIDHTTGSVRRTEIGADTEWLERTIENDSADFSAIVTLTSEDPRSPVADPMFDGLVRISPEDREIQTGVFRTRGENKRVLGFATNTGYYELDADCRLQRVDDAAAEEYCRAKAAIPKGVVTLDPASILIVDDRGRRWRLPRASRDYDRLTEAGELRVCREVATERDLLNVCGTFFELPAENADGFAKLRPICSHDLRVTDFGSYRGLFLMSGLRADARASEHILRSDDGRASIWAGAVDDLWKLGKPRGQGGPWQESDVTAAVPSDPYLMWAYDRRTLTLHHDQTTPISFRVELDLTGTGLWVTHLLAEIPPGQARDFLIPSSVQARWLRVTANSNCRATAQLVYE